MTKMKMIGATCTGMFVALGLMTASASAAPMHRMHRMMHHDRMMMHHDRMMMHRGHMMHHRMMMRHHGMMHRHMMRHGM